MRYLTALVAVAALGVAVYGLHRLLTWAAEREWIYYGKHQRKPGYNFNFLATIYQPSMEHVIEEQQRIRVMADEQEVGEDDPPMVVLPPA